MTSNPYDPADRPGAHLVAEQLGLDDPWDLTESYAADDPLHIVSWLIAEAAREVDTLHLSLTRAAKAAADLLAPICLGAIDWTDRNGVLTKAAPRIDVLAARRAVAYDQLTRSIATFRRLDSYREPNGTSKAAARNRERDQLALQKTDPGPATPRVSAALSRSTSVPEPRPGAEVPVPAAQPAPAPVRPRRSPSA